MSAFEYCKNLQSIELPEGITSIWKRAFLDCTSLKKVILPDSITEMDRMVFWGCSSLEAIRIPRGITVISDHLTFDCHDMVNVYIPKSVIKIEESAFGANFSRYVPNIFYEGTESDWQKVTVEEGNRQYTYMDNFTFNSYPDSYNVQ